MFKALVNMLHTVVFLEHCGAVSVPVLLLRERSNQSLNLHPTVRSPTILCFQFHSWHSYAIVN